MERKIRKEVNLEYKEYQHIVKMDDPEVEGLTIGKCHIFPKIDGTNSSLWCDPGVDTMQAGSRHRHLTLDNDNAGFYNAMRENPSVENFFADNPEMRLYGEWLVPHTLKTYRADAWRKFYVFDVTKYDPDSDTESYIPYDIYSEFLKRYEIEFIPPIRIIVDPTHEDLQRCIQLNTFLIREDSGIGEGIVIKNYEFVNKYGRITWGKIVTNEFKDKNYKEMGAPERVNLSMEKELVGKFLSVTIVDKLYANILMENDTATFSKQWIPRILEQSYHDFVTEEIWTMVKHINKNKHRGIDFKNLQQHAFNKVKEYYPQLFRRTPE